MTMINNENFQMTIKLQRIWLSIQNGKFPDDSFLSSQLKKKEEEEEREQEEINRQQNRNKNNNQERCKEKERERDRERQTDRKKEVKKKERCLFYHLFESEYSGTIQKATNKKRESAAPKDKSRVI